MTKVHGLRRPAMTALGTTHVQIFPRSANAIAKFVIIGVPTLIVIVIYAVWQIFWSPYVHGVGIGREQPVLFSHKHHVTQIGLDCRYCHASAETEAHAGIPATEVCMNCHAYVLTGSPLLEPVRESWRTGTPLRWERVHSLPDHVFFNHGIHVQKGVGCATCHGRVDLMPMTWKEQPLYMRWCLDCHENPGPHLRPQDAIYAMDWKPPEKEGERRALARDLLKANGIRQRLNDCYVCHR